MGLNSRWTNSIISGGAIYAAGTTAFKTAKAASATNMVTGQVRADQGFYFGKGNAKNFSAGTYIGTGAATAAITTTGLTTVHHVFMSLRGAAYGSAATNVDGRIICAPVLANGTTGSFYPLAYRSTGTNKNVTLGTGIAATFSWMAVGL
jgi:hypothetical protein